MSVQCKDEYGPTSEDEKIHAASVRRRPCGVAGSGRVGGHDGVRLDSSHLPSSTSQAQEEVACYSTHSALKLDPARWATLPYGGVQKLRYGGEIELRTCPGCKSTLAMRRVEAQS